MWGGEGKLNSNLLYAMDLNWWRTKVLWAPTGHVRVRTTRLSRFKFFRRENAPFNTKIHAISTRNPMFYAKCIYGDRVFVKKRTSRTFTISAEPSTSSGCCHGWHRLTDVSGIWGVFFFINFFPLLFLFSARASVHYNLVSRRDLLVRVAGRTQKTAVLGSPDVYLRIK